MPYRVLVGRCLDDLEDRVNQFDKKNPSAQVVCFTYTVRKFPALILRYREVKSPKRNRRTTSKRRAKKGS
jgi:hypothetical protein